VLALLPVQRLRAVADVVYDVTLTGLGSFRVSVRAADATVEPVAEPGGAEFHVGGTAAELAEFAAGGIGRRPAQEHPGARQPPAPEAPDQAAARARATGRTSRGPARSASRG